MAFYFSRRKLKVREEGHAGELNIVPYLDILMNLIIFMLLSMTGLAAFGILNVNAPNYGPASNQGAGQDNPDQKLLLTVAVSRKGFFVAGAGAVLGSQSPAANQVNTQGQPTIPKNPDGTYDFATLQAQMVTIKKSFPAETKVVVAAEADTTYETLIQTMDSIRETEGAEHKILFPDVTLAAM